MKKHTLNSEVRNILNSLGVLMATSSQYSNLAAIHHGKESDIRAIKEVKGDEGFDILNYTKVYLETAKELVDIEKELDVIFEGFMKESSVVPCQQSELKSFFQLMYEKLTGMKD